MMSPTAGIFKNILKNGTYVSGDIHTTEYKHYSYSVNSELKQFIIYINVADVKKFSGANEFEQTLARDNVLSYYLEDFKTELGQAGLFEKEHYLINKTNHTIVVNENGYKKLLTKKDFPNLLMIVTVIFSFQHDKPHEVAAIINNIMLNNHPCFRITRNSVDNNAYELYAGGGSSENLSKQLRDSFRTAAVAILNHPDTERVKAPVKEDQLPDQLSTTNNSSEGFSKFIFLSGYMFNLLKKESSEIKDKIPKPEIPEPIIKAGIKFAGDGQESDEKSDRKLNGKGRTFKTDTKKRRSLALSVQLNVTDENREVWQHAITTGLAADMEGILPENKIVTLDNKYEICHKLEEFFLNKEKISNIKMINLLFLGLLDLKDDINVHKHGKYDSVMFKKNTDSWQKLVKNIRDRAYELLTEEIEGKDDLTAIKILKKYSEENIFKLHRANAFFMKFGSTKTVKKIEVLIEERQKNYVEKGKKIEPI